MDRLYVDDQEKVLQFYTDKLDQGDGSIIAQLDDTCGNSFQLTPLAWG